VAEMQQSRCLPHIALRAWIIWGVLPDLDEQVDGKLFPGKSVLTFRRCLEAEPEKPPRATRFTKREDDAAGMRRKERDDPACRMLRLLTAHRLAREELVGARISNSSRGGTSRSSKAATTTCGSRSLRMQPIACSRESASMLSQSISAESLNGSGLKG